MAPITIDPARCTGCGVCVEICPGGSIVAHEDGTAVTVPPGTARCLECGQCRAYCPTGAIAGDCGGGGREETGTVPAAILARHLKSRRSIRHYRAEMVPRETIEAILDVARYAPTGGNRQPIGWLFVHDREEVHRLADLTVDWMRHEAAAESPLMPRTVLGSLVEAWDRGEDPNCRGAPHLIVAHVPDQSAFVDWIIALSWVDAITQAHGVGTCWAVFLMIAASRWPPLMDALALSPGRMPAFALMCGFPRNSSVAIPSRKPLSLAWR